jgi:mRNA interferase RelE/StbE
MNYRIEYLEEVFPQLASIPKNIRRTILRAIDERLAVDPFRFKPLIGNSKVYYRMRVGDYRVIYKIYDNKVTVLVVKVAVRRGAYD